MGLDVGVVTINYLERPRQPIYGFLNDLLNEASWESDASDDDPAWSASWEGNGLVEYSRGYLERRSNQWADSQSLDLSERTALTSWLDSLPWRNDMIMLHLNR